MKIIAYITLLTLSIFMLSGCGSESSSSQVESEDIQKIELETGVEQDIISGDELVNNDDNTTVKIIQELDTDVKRVVLLSGSATLLRNTN